MSSIRTIGSAPHLSGEVHVPGDKSGSHRALLLSALAPGTSSIEGMSPGADVGATARIIQRLGARLEARGPLTEVHGPQHGLRACDHNLDCGNSGTSMRLLAGLLSGIEGHHLLVGDESLSKRPMDRVAVPLKMMGAGVQGVGTRVCAPLNIEGRRQLRAIDYHVPIASAQVKSALLFAALCADGPSTIREDVRTRSTTEDMMHAAGIDLGSVDHDAGRTVRIRPGRPRARRWRVPGDPSQAAFFAVLGAIHENATIKVASMDDAPERTGFVTVLLRMGAHVELQNGSHGVSLTSSSAELHATEVISSEIPSVDEVPVLSVAAAAANGVSAFRDMGELRVKESDRFAGSIALARALGCRVWEEGDDFFIEGRGGARHFASFTLAPTLDHRMVMASAVAALAGRGATLEGADTVSSSYPNFFEDLASLRE